MPSPERTLRTRARLFEAVLELAAERDVAEVTATDVATRAGVHRTTFYEYADAPVALLRQALADGLDILREHHLRGSTPADVAERVHRVTLGVLDHLEEHEEVYRRLDDATGSALQAFLSTHFQTSARLLVEQGALAIPPVAGVDPGLVADLAVRYIADGYVGAFAVWLRTPAPRDREALFRVLDGLLPSWWPSA
jgi:AcrR family transcriptional regulator